MEEVESGKGHYMQKRRLQEAIRQLRNELEQAPSVDDRVRQHIQNVLDEIETVTDAQGTIPSHQHQHLLDKLKGSARHFEESHLPLTLAVGRVIDALSSMGI